MGPFGKLEVGQAPYTVVPMNLYVCGSVTPLTGWLTLVEPSTMEPLRLELCTLPESASCASTDS